jgi:vacuolar iron transporter family protein
LEQLEAKQSSAAVEEEPVYPPEAVPPAPTASLPGTTSFPADGIPSLNLETYVAAVQEVDRERFRVANLGRLREVVFGAQDGILSTVALVTSVAVAVGDNATVLVAGLAAALAGMLSMATGAYLGSRAEQDVQRAEIAREAQELEENPGEELAELVVIFQREGKTYDEARQLADEISKDKELWLNTLIEKELGISPEETTNPIKDALVMGASFIIAALIPIIPYLFLDGIPAIEVSVAGALIGLFVLGMGKGRLVQRSPILQGLEILGIGAVSAGVGFLLGEGIPRLLT